MDNKKKIEKHEKQRQPPKSVQVKEIIEEKKREAEVREETYLRTKSKKKL